MIVAAVEVSGGHFASHGFTHIVEFDDLALAYSEFDRVSELLRKRMDRANDLPTTVDLVGVNKYSAPLETLYSVSLIDYAKLNEQRRGLGDAYPNLRFRP